MFYWIDSKEIIVKKYWQLFRNIKKDIMPLLLLKLHLQDVENLKFGYVFIAYHYYLPP